MTETIWKRWATRRVSLLIVLLMMAMPAWGLDRPPWDKLTTKVGPDAEVPGWYINLGITGVRAMITKEEPTNLLVMFVFRDTPAFGEVEKGDKIIGANDHAFVTPHKFGYGMGKFAAAGFLGDFISRDDARAGRFAVDRQNTFNAFVNPLFNTPIDYGYQLAAKKDDLYNFRPQEYALERQRNFLADERELNPIVRQNKANDLKTAGKYRQFQKMLESPYGPYVPIQA